jgi:hypothetical protein
MAPCKSAERSRTWTRPSWGSGGENFLRARLWNPRFVNKSAGGLKNTRSSRRGGSVWMSARIRRLFSLVALLVIHPQIQGPRNSITARRGSLLQQQLHLSLPSTPGRRGSADQAISIQTLLVARPTSNAVFRSSSYIGKRRHIVAILTLGLPQGHNRHSARDATITLCLCTGRRIPLPLLLGASFAS